MDNAFFSSAVGLVCGVLSGLGIGGGSLLMLYLTAFAGLAPEAARGVNLFYFLPTAAVSLALHAKNRFVLWQNALPAALAGCVSAGLLAWLSAGAAPSFLRYGFGALLLLAGCAELRAGLRKS